MLISPLIVCLILKNEAMNFSLDSLVTPDEILADVLTETEDFDYRDFTRGWYMSQMQQCLEELSFDTFMVEIDNDFPFPSETSAISLPANAFNVRGIWVYNGSLGVPTNSQIVSWKRGAYSRGSGKSFFAEHKAGQTENPWILPISDTVQSELIWASINNGVVQFSSQAATYSYVHLRYNGTFTPIGETPFVPPFFRQVVKLWVTLEYYRRMRKRNPRVYRTIFKDVYDELYGGFSSKWDTAITRSKSIDTKSANDLKEYLSKMNY